MPLSDREQEMLDQIEQALYAEDPKFAASVRSAQRSRGRRWFALCVIGVLAGLGTVLAGLTMKGTGVGIGLGVAGFLLIVASCLCRDAAHRACCGYYSAWQGRADEHQLGSQGRRTQPHGGSPPASLRRGLTRSASILVQPPRTSQRSRIL